MSLSLEKIERLAPDQSSLAAAKKLLKPATWPSLAEDGQGLLWGECQGSGATPYRIAVTEADAGYKCTCPSRKFPCKHALALMWMRAEGSATFASGSPPQWVHDWLGRRRGPVASKSTSTDQPEEARPSIAAIEEPEETAPDPAAAARAEAQRVRNRAQREALVRDGISAMDRWLEDQLERGLGGFDQRATETCAILARRLVDAKAGGLANRVAMIPSRLFELAEADRAAVAAQQLSQLHIIGQAYLRQADLDGPLGADVRQMVGWNLTRETLLDESDALRADGTWRVLGVRDEVQPDRLRRIETWLERAEGEPRYAVLIDFIPVAGGGAGNNYASGELLDATLVFYPSPVPMRAQVEAHRGTTPASAEWGGAGRSLAEALSEWQAALGKKPWLGEWPLSAGGVRLRSAGGELYMTGDGFALPIARSSNDAARPLLELDEIEVFGIWDGLRLVPMLANTRLGAWMDA